MKLDDEKLKGKRFGKLILLYRVGKDKQGGAIFRFKCDCGTEKDIRYSNVRDNNTKSCGCIKTGGIKTHGMTGKPEYRVWYSMKHRCYNSNLKAYPDYGGRGIVVCDRWRDSFENFYKDMGQRPSEKHTLDRKDNNGNYCKENCRWATQKEQNRNKRDNYMITYNGKTKCLIEWVEELNLSYSSFYYWLKIKKVSVEEVFQRVKYRHKK